MKVKERIESEKDLLENKPKEETKKKEFKGFAEGRANTK